MKLLGKKLYRTRPIKLYKGGFGGGAPSAGGIAESIGAAVPQTGSVWEGPQPVPVPDPPEYVPYPIEGPDPIIDPRPPQAVPMPVEPEPTPIRPPDVPMPVGPAPIKPSPSPIGPGDEPIEGYQHPSLGESPDPSPIQRPWDEEESFTSISEQLGDINVGGPKPVQDIEWQAGVEGPGIFGQERPPSPGSVSYTHLTLPTKA